MSPGSSSIALVWDVTSMCDASKELNSPFSIEDPKMSAEIERSRRWLLSMTWRHPDSYLECVRERRTDARTGGLRKAV